MRIYDFFLRLFIKINLIKIIFLRNKKNILFIIKLFNLFIIFIYILFISFIKIKNIINSKIINQINNFENLNIIDETEIINFHTINNNNILLDKKKYNRSEYPDISIILTVYNQAHYIHQALRSIQNQSIKNLEIIVIDDCSIDNSIEVIESFKKADDRITILSHESNEGKIKSRAQGVRIAKGKYITILDGDDSFIHSKILYNGLYIANLANLDVVEFKASYYLNEKFIRVVNNYYQDNRIIYQPELKTKFINIKDDDSVRPIINRSICFKLIKNSIFKKIINIIGPRYTEEYMLNYEDTIMSYILFKVANSYYLMKERGYYYSKTEDKYQFQQKKKCKRTINIIKKTIDPIKFLYFLLEKTKNNKIERKVIYHEIISINYYNKIINVINNNDNYALNILKVMIKCRYLSKIEKEKLIYIFNNLKNK